MANVTPKPIPRFYYKEKNGERIICLRNSLAEVNLDTYEEISEEQYRELINAHVKQPSEKELAIREKKKAINELKAKLAATDEYAILLAEGEITKEGEYKQVFIDRKAWRAQINEIQEELEELESDE